MSSYICVSHAESDCREADRLLQMLFAYGFRYRRIDELTDTDTRKEILSGAAVLLALTSPAAASCEAIAADMAYVCRRQGRVLCVYMGELPAEGYSAGGNADPEAITFIPYPMGERPDRAAVGLFAHRLFLRCLCGIRGIYEGSSHVGETFDAADAEGKSLCDRATGEAIGQAIALAMRVEREGGDMAAAYRLGCAYAHGEGVPVMEDEAARLIGLAAEAGEPDALLHMGELYLTGHGVEADFEEAFHLFSRSAEAGDVRGEFGRGLCYLYGLGVTEDPARAVPHLRLAACKGFAPAIYQVGVLARDGIGMPVNTREALMCFSHAYRLALRGGTNSGGIVNDSDPTLPAMHLYRRVAHRPKAASMREWRRRAPLRRAVTARLEREYEKALRNSPRALPPTAVQLEEAVARSFNHMRTTAICHPEDAVAMRLVHPTAKASEPKRGGGLFLAACGERVSVSDVALALGRLLETGAPSEGVYPFPTRAMVWYRYAACCGRPEAACRLADAYRSGMGVPTDALRAAELYKGLSECGHVPARFALGVCYERGIGVKRDPMAAVRLYEQAAEAGYAPAQNNLGGCYESGIGVPRNRVLAVEWYARAAAADLPEALCRFGLCYETGHGLPVDAEQAFRLYERAAHRGNAHALYRLGVCCSRATYSTARYPDEAGAEERQSECSSRADLNETGGDSRERLPQYGRARELWEQACAAGSAEAAYALALCEIGGYGTRRDDARAYRYLSLASKRGSVAAATQLGFFCLEGRGTVRNLRRAVSCFRRAVRLWREGRLVHAYTNALLPVDALSPSEAAGDALYMLGYCALYGVGLDDTASQEVPTSPQGAAASGGQVDSAASLSPVENPSEERVARAAAYFREAAEVQHVGAMTALGDLYTYGLLPAEKGMSASDMATTAYRRAAETAQAYREGTSSAGAYRLRRAPRTYADELRESAVHALMTLADAAHSRAESCHENQLVEAEQEAWGEFRRLCEAAADGGSTDALVGLAECVHYGRGVAQDRPAARRLLEQANSRGQGNMMAALWLGDFLRCGWCGPNCGEDADTVYRNALNIPETQAVDGLYILENRRRARMEKERRARAELYYRIATLRAVDLSEDADRSDAFPYLAEAVMMGHEMARTEWARIYDHAKTYVRDTAPVATSSASLSRRERWRAQLSRWHLFGRRRSDASEVAINSGLLSGATYNFWVADYYSTLWPRPKPFAYPMQPDVTPSEIREHNKTEVTAAMMINAVNHLGDCFFYGQELSENPRSAVSCYRDAVSQGRNIKRGEAIPSGLIWAQYSLGWCLLHGRGTEKNPCEAVQWLTAAARSHAQAAFVLAECYEHGVGMDLPDEREAVKYYRRALKLGCREAEPKVGEMIERLRHSTEEE